MSRRPERRFAVIVATCLRHVPRLLACALAMSLAASVQAQSWPAKPVKMIASFAPGSAPDIVARLVADQLSRAWG